MAESRSALCVVAKALHTVSDKLGQGMCLRGMQAHKQSGKFVTGIQKRSQCSIFTQVKTAAIPMASVTRGVPVVHPRGMLL